MVDRTKSKDGQGRFWAFWVVFKRLFAVGELRYSDKFTVNVSVNGINPHGKGENLAI
jgi:hypothetical protein